VLGVRHGTPVAEGTASAVVRVGGSSSQEISLADWWQRERQYESAIARASGALDELDGRPSLSLEQIAEVTAPLEQENPGLFGDERLSSKVERLEARSAEIRSHAAPNASSSLTSTAQPTFLDVLLTALAVAEIGLRNLWRLGMATLDLVRAFMREHRQIVCWTVLRLVQMRFNQFAIAHAPPLLGHVLTSLLLHAVPAWLILSLLAKYALGVSLDDWFSRQCNGFSRE
jgi:hypothetical protein